MAEPPDPREEAERALADAVAIVLGQLREVLPDDFSGAVGGVSPIAYFKGAPPARALQIVEGSPRYVQLVGGTGFTAPQLHRIKLLVNEEVVRTFGAAGTVVRGDEHGRVTVTLPLTRETIEAAGLSRPPLDRPGVKAHLIEQIRPPSGVSIEVVDGVALSNPSSQWSPTGGTTLYRQGAKWCTSAFVVKAKTGPDLGELTAGHCATASQADPLSHNLEFSINRRTYYYDSRGDAAFYRSPRMMAGIFQHNHGQFRSVLAARSPYLNESICRFGHKTGKHCGSVVDADICVVGLCNMYLGNIYANDQGGDSGGPWYYSTTAMGVHYGYIFFPFDPLGQHFYDGFTGIGSVLTNTGTMICKDLAPDPRCE